MDYAFVAAVGNDLYLILYNTIMILTVLTTKPIRHSIYAEGAIHDIEYDPSVHRY
jgi:hypothetical protein